MKEARHSLTERLWRMRPPAPRRMSSGLVIAVLLTLAAIVFFLTALPPDTAR